MRYAVGTARRGGATAASIVNTRDLDGRAALAEQGLAPGPTESDESNVYLAGGWRRAAGCLEL